MTEYLDSAKNYTYVQDTARRSEDWIEIPEGAEKARFYPRDSNGIEFENKFNQWWHDEENKWVDYIDLVNRDDHSRIVWQRDETEYLMQGKNAERLMESVGQLKGMKFDSEKPRYSLLPKGAVNSVIAVLEFGAKKYDVDNWQEVDNAKERYYNAAMRHIDLWWSGEKHDSETNIHHLAHAATNLFFLMWFDNK